MAKTLVINADNCTGCRLCELVCSFRHTELFKPTASRIKVKLNTKEGISTPQVCKQCEEHPCLEACIEDAISKDEKTGVIIIDKAKCTLCKECIFACPHGAISYEGDSKEVIVCDRCGGDPECVKTCFPGALTWV